MKKMPIGRKTNKAYSSPDTIRLPLRMAQMTANKYDTRNPKRCRQNRYSTEGRSCNSGVPKPAPIAVIIIKWSRYALKNIRNPLNSFTKK